MNDRCEKLNMILASLLKQCFSGHAHFCTVSYHMIKLDELNFRSYLLAKRTFHKYFTTCSKNNKL